MGNDYEQNSSNYSDDIHIENNSCIGQGQGDFEEAFNQIFNKKENNKEQDKECNEINHKAYFLQNTGIFTQKEEPEHICYKNFFIKSSKKSILDKDNKNIINEKKIFTINDQNSLMYEDDKKNKKIFEISKDSNMNLEEIENEEIKIEETNNIMTETDKQNIFRVYSSKDFNIFHPGGTVDFYRQIKEDIFKQEKSDTKLSYNINKFKIYKDKKKAKRKIKEKKKRKEKPDDIRKKIKSRFLKATKNRINQMLKSAKSKEYFDFLPQCFICNISKQKNTGVINMTLKELISQKFYEEDIKTDNNDNIMLQKKRKADKKKYEKNIKVLKYLEKNYNISQKSNFNVIGNMTFRDVFNEYLKSEEFEKEIEKLKNEKNDDKYIKDYIIKAYSFISYFSSSQ